MPVGVIKEALGNSGCMLSWLSCKCYFWLLKSALEIFFSKKIHALLLDRCMLSAEVEWCTIQNQNLFQC